MEPIFVYVTRCRDDFQSTQILAGSACLQRIEHLSAMGDKAT
jgi:hypothetical protein